LEQFKFDNFPVLHTDRLILREITMEDAQNIYDILNNFEVVRYDSFDRFTSIKQAETLIKIFYDCYKKQKAIFWGISFKGSDKVIGFCKLEINVPEVRGEYGYDLNYNYWNQGIMTETLTAVVDFSVHQLNINRVEASVSVGNVASIKVLKKCGFIEEGIMRSRSFWKGKYHDMMILSLLKDDIKLR